MADEKHEQPQTPAPAKGAKIPAAAAAAAYAPRAAGEDDASAEANSRIAADIANRANPPIPAEQLVTAPTSEPLVNGRAMYVLVGPYRGNVLTMTDADGESAKDNHWAIDIVDMNKPFDADTPYDHDHELTDEDRAYAVKEANEWAAAQNPPPEPPADTPPEGQAKTVPEGQAKTTPEGQAKTTPAKTASAPAPKPAANKSVEPAPSVAGYETR